MLNILSTQKKR